MPYVIKKERKKGEKPFAIVNQKTGVVVGRSNTMNKAYRSAGYRMAAEAKKRT